MEVVRGTFYIANPFPIGTIDLKTCITILDADVDVAGGTNRNVAVHVADFVTTFWKLHPIGYGFIVLFRGQASHQGQEEDEREGLLDVSHL